jgi:hypothetical protein
MKMRLRVKEQGQTMLVALTNPDPMDCRLLVNVGLQPNWSMARVNDLDLYDGIIIEYGMSPPGGWAESQSSKCEKPGAKGQARTARRAVVGGAADWSGDQDPVTDDRAWTFYSIHGQVQFR